MNIRYKGILIILMIVIMSLPATAKMSKPSLKELVNQSNLIVHVKMINVKEWKTDNHIEQIGEAEVIKKLKGSFEYKKINVSFSSGKPMSVPYEEGEFVLFLNGGKSNMFHLSKRWFSRCIIDENGMVGSAWVGKTDNKKYSVSELYQRINEIIKKEENVTNDSVVKPQSVNESKKDVSPKNRKLEIVKIKINEKTEKFKKLDPEKNPIEYEKLKNQIVKLKLYLKKLEDR